MNQNNENKIFRIKKHWKKYSLAIVVITVVGLSFYSVESTRDQYNQVQEKVYLPIFKTDEEIKKINDKAIHPDDRPKPDIPFIDYEKHYANVKQGLILFQKLQFTERKISEFCKLQFSFGVKNEIIGELDCHSLATPQEKVGIKNAFYDLLKRKPGFFVDQSPVKKIVEQVVEKIIEQNETGDQYEFRLKELMGIEN